MPSSDPPSRDKASPSGGDPGARAAEGRRASSLFRVALRFLMFCVPIVLVLIVAEMGLRRVDNSYSKKLRALEEAREDLAVLVTGTSTGLYGVDPALFSAKGYNMANVSQSPYYDDALVRPRLSSLPKLRLVLVVLSTPSLEMRLGDSPEHRRQFWYERYWGIPPEVPESMLDARQVSVAALYTRAHALSALQRGFHYDIAPQITASGYMPFDTDGTLVDAAHAATRTEYHRSIMKPANVERNLEALTRLTRAAKERGVALAIVLPPTSIYYQKQRDPEAFGRMLIALAHMEREGATIASYLDDTRFEDADFADPDHLGVRGAKKFSKILDEELVAPAITR